MKIVVAVSGGMDSLYSLMHLQEAGHDVAALHARFISVQNDPVPALSALCKTWGIPLHVADLKDEFRSEVIIPFLKSYANGDTPNPCAWCNRYMKFGRLLQIARNLSAECFATGHYVHMEEYFVHGKSYGLCLKNAKDSSKDQSYFLALTALDDLRHCIFPLADKEKQLLRRELEQRGIAIPHDKESQEVCFVPENNYRVFLEKECAKRQISLGSHGDMLYVGMKNGELAQEVIAKHEGLWNYTEGQRKGLKVAWSEPLYVLEKDKENNRLLVSTKDQIHMAEAKANQINFIVPPSLWPEKIYVRTRFREQPFCADVLVYTEDGNMVQIGMCNANIIDKHTGVLNEDNIIITDEYSEFYHNQNSSYLFHVREEDTLLNDPYKVERDRWNKINCSITVRFHSVRQVYARGQVLALYDENGFVLAGGILQ